MLLRQLADAAETPATAVELSDLIGELRFLEGKVADHARTFDRLGLRSRRMAGAAKRE
ncbi:hypothetical protein [Streptomyces cavernicola]|uniref:Uncharacterized protein n=1 Tax=Streptomyces cavernicola TaxID=3043613 RepID=A0ABT6S515_9ACTN|nr:hypothetical protein [Streptomyces sp. B-S-A6]MDI3403168.1 hypothetical protein [Streptomyces sp. B-S-A6]